MTDKKEKTQYERIRDYLMAGEIITSLDAAMLAKPIMDLPKRVSELRADGYDIDQIKRGRATGYYMPDHVDHGALAAWAAKPMYKAV